MDYKEIIILRVLELELNKQRHIAWKKLNKYVESGKSFQNIEYKTLEAIKDFYRDSAEEIAKKLR
jgi:hypothetical protein